jgi:flagellar hook-associated protein 2
MNVNEETGFITLEEDKLNSQIKSDYTVIKGLFSGYEATSYGGTTNHIDGVFTEMKETLKNLIEGDDSTLGSYDKRLDKDQEKLEEAKKAEQKRLDKKYETMQMQWAYYDSIIANLNNSFKVLQMQIDMAINAKK